MSSSDFSTLTLRVELPAAIDSLDYESMTPIQAQSLPVMLAGSDVLAQANTGSGKTAAFAIAMLNKLEEQRYQTQGIVICPTRELADQVADEIRRLARTIANVKVLTLCGGKPFGPQLASLHRAPHIVVGTPGRLLKHLEKESLVLTNIETLVLDEADRMLDMGFSEDISKIISFIPDRRQTLLFSATYPDEIGYISKSIQLNPVTIKVDSDFSANQITQIFYKAPKPDRVQILIQVLKFYQPESALVFCNTIEQCEVLVGELIKRDVHALTLHGDLEQFDRDQVLVRFSNRSTSVLVATDVAARGLDIKELDAVVNFEITRDPEVHVHRIGRTGRAGSEGLAISLYGAEETSRLNAIEHYLGATVNKKNPSELRSVVKESMLPKMVTLFIGAGRKDKLRAGDVLGALTSSSELTGANIGKINLFDKFSYVAVDRQSADRALEILSDGKIKGRSFRIKRLR